MNRAHWIVAGLMAAVCLTGSSRMFVPKAKPAATGGTATRRVLDRSMTSARAPSRPSAPSNSWLRRASYRPPRSASRPFWCRRPRPDWYYRCMLHGLSTQVGVNRFPPFSP